MAITQITNNVILDGTILPAKLNISPALKTFLGDATSANLASAVSGTTGSGNLVFADSPTITTPTITSVSSAVGNPFTISTNYATSTIANVAVRNQATNGLAAVSFLTPGYTANGFIGYGNASSTQYTDQVFFCSAGKLLSISTAFGSRHLVIDTTGNVGIGTTTPSEKLTVAGNISATGTVSGSNLVYNTGDQPIAGIKTFSNDIVGNGTANSLPNQTLSSSDNNRILTQKTSARDDMWSAWQKRWIQGFANSAIGGGGFGGSAGTMSFQVTCGTPAIGRAGAFGEPGMTVNPGQGAVWSIPSSFAVAFGFFSLKNNNVVTSNNITNGSNTFTISSILQISVGHRIYSPAFPEETYVSAINGTSITATKNATSTPTTPHTVVFSPDQISRVVLGTNSATTRYELDCPNAQEVFLTSGGRNIGDTSLRILSNIVSNSVAVMWSGQPYFILTTANASIAANNATTFYAACTNFPISVTMNVLRCDNVVGTPVTTTGTWNGTVTPTNQITVASGTNIVANQTVSGLGIPQNTTVSSIVGTTVTLSQNITTSGSGVALYFGYQRIFVDQNATATATGQNCGFLLKNTLNQYIYGRGVTSGTTITNITSFSSNIFDFTISNALTKAYVNGVFLSVNFTTNNNTSTNNCIFMDFGSDPADGYLKVRLGFMLNGLITYSPWTSFSKGNVPSGSYNYYYQAVIDYNAATDRLRLFADRNGDIVTSGNPRDFPKPPSTPTITMTGVSGLNDKATNLSFGLHIYGNNVNALANAFTARFDTRQLVYYPYQTFID